MTRWNVFALAGAIIGTLCTLGLDHWWMHHWLNSGVTVPVGERADVSLNQGRVLAYYESNDAVPLPGMAAIHVIGPSGESLPVMPAPDTSDYSIQRHNSAGRQLWEFEVREEGMYDIGGFNHHYHSDADIPKYDRIVINRRPESLSQAVLIRNIIRITGLTVTLLLVIVFYIPHVRTVKRLAGRAADGTPPPATPASP